MRQLILWAVMEIFLNLVGLDDMADYVEFLQDMHTTIQIPKVHMAR
ncbi:MAG: hypothetical protein R3321_01610 [Nitrososphaeraceae archaeon]|nr:hypothetical protein [Nitrososphaeraceae archaeon]